LLVVAWPASEPRRMKKQRCLREKNGEGDEQNGTAMIVSQQKEHGRDYKEGSCS
jgi:hypothetical protein